MKKKKLLVLIFIILIIGVLFAVNGVSFVINGSVCFSTKYYSTPKDAFLKEEEDFPQQINEDIGVIDVDEYNSIYLASLEDSQILVAMMRKNDSSYFYTGEYTIYSNETESYTKDMTLNCNSYSLYNKYGWGSGDLEMTVLYDMDYSYSDIHDYSVETFVNKSSTIYVVYKMK